MLSNMAPACSHLTCFLMGMVPLSAQVQGAPGSPEEWWKEEWTRAARWLRWATEFPPVESLTKTPTVILPQRLVWLICSSLG